MAESRLLAQYDPAVTPRFAAQGCGTIRLVRQYPDEAAPHILAPWSLVRSWREVEGYAAREGAELQTVRRSCPPNSCLEVVEVVCDGVRKPARGRRSIAHQRRG